MTDTMTNAVFDCDTFSEIFETWQKVCNATLRVDMPIDNIVERMTDFLKGGETKNLCSKLGILTAGFFFADPFSGNISFFEDTYDRKKTISQKDISQKDISQKYSNQTKSKTYVTPYFNDRFEVLENELLTQVPQSAILL